MTWINGLVPWLKSAYPRRLRIGSLVEIRLSTSSVVLYQNGKISDYAITKFMGPLAAVVGVLNKITRIKGWTGLKPQRI